MSCCRQPKKEENHTPESHAHAGACCSPSSQHSHQESDHTESESCCSSKKSDPNQKVEVARQMTIEEILNLFPYKAQKLSQEITNAGLHCVGCQAATWETLEAGMLSHGKTEAQIDHLVQRLNALLEEKVDTNTITLTSNAATKFLAFAAEADKQGWGIRLDEQMAGCNGFEYSLDFAEKAEADDEVFVSQGIEIYVKKAALPRLIGCEIDYKDGLRGSGFTISNPNVQSSCGCGSSHGY